MKHSHSTDAVDPRSGRGPPRWRVVFGDGVVVFVDARSSGYARAAAQDQRWPGGLPIITNGHGNVLQDVFRRCAIKKVKRCELNLPTSPNTSGAI